MQTRIQSACWWQWGQRRGRPMENSGSGAAVAGKVGGGRCSGAWGNAARAASMWECLLRLERRP